MKVEFERSSRSMLYFIIGIFIMTTICTIYIVFAGNNVMNKQDKLIVKQGTQIESLKAGNRGLIAALATERSKKAELEEQLHEIHSHLAKPKNFLEELQMTKATITAYSPLDDQNGINSDGESETTSIGLKAGHGIFAVDPERIPYGSDILIIYPDGSMEEGIAGDTGGAMRNAAGIKIDVFRQTFHEATQFGKREATVLWKPKVR